jgi:hypothetical protein
MPDIQVTSPNSLIFNPLGFCGSALEFHLYKRFFEPASGQSLSTSHDNVFA